MLNYHKITKLKYCIFCNRLDMDEEKWIRGELLGKGGNARVYSMQNVQTGKFYAGKFSGTDLIPKVGETSWEADRILKSLQKSRKMLMKEIKIHRRLRHPNIVEYISSFRTTSCYEEKEIIVTWISEGSCEVLVLELCPNKSLFELLKHRGTVDYEECRFFIYGLAKALVYLKQNNVIHKDVKLHNIFLDGEMNVKLGDFGLASIDGIVGTPNYIAPEMLQGMEPSFPVDTWALGVCLYTLYYGKPPFETSSLKETYNRIKKAIYYFKRPPPPAMKDLIEKIFVTNPENRIEIEDVLKHPFFTEKPMLTSIPVIARIEKPGILDREIEYPMDRTEVSKSEDS